MYGYKSMRQLDEDWLDYLQINGTIKCWGFSININLNDLFLYIPNLRSIEYALGKWTDQGNRIENNGYDQDCYQHSRTFNNYSYNFVEICVQSGECLSIYRFSDGIDNCGDAMDEIDDHRVLSMCSKIQRYRFHCSAEEATWLSVVALGNKHPSCFNNFDELWLGTSLRIFQMDCNNQSQNKCGILRQYIETSRFWWFRWRSYFRSGNISSKFAGHSSPQREIPTSS